ncbi:SusC/RagA family TonB-linked outer membrane protein [Labilibaculum sp.]|uniref:SusC/RagA family TonB-linked outer membrane protein n=1 Tax=Labilibaculum sp. TaxID=2060723 RepID=UPI003568F405
MRKIRLTVLMCLIATMGWAQKLSVHGSVVDEQGPLPGASVIVKGSAANKLVGTITDINGEFSLMVNTDDVLIVSFMGYTSQEVAVIGSTFLVVELTGSATELEQVLVVGYGTQKKSSSVASISQTKGDDLQKAGGVTSVTEALQGMMPGVTSVVSNGKPGDSDALDIMIRGVSSWNDASPLVLVDGVERGMDDVAPNEIESISVLKDASATAVFGVKGGNGVILITTKRGVVSDKPKISFSANYGIKTAMTVPKFTDYVTSMNMWNEALSNDGQWEDLIPESTINAWKNAYENGLVGANSDYFPEVDWWDKIVGVGTQQQYNINVRGGSQFMKYFVSMSYLNDGDVFKTQKNDLFDPSFYYKRYNWRTNFDLNITKSTVVSVNMAGKYAHRNQAGYRIDGNSEDGYGQSSFFNALYTGDQNSFPIYWSDGTYGSDDTGGGNIYANLDLGQRIYKYFEGAYDIKLKQDLNFITKGLSAEGMLSYSSSSNYESTIQRYEGGNFGVADYIRYSRKYDYSSQNADGSYNYTSTRWPDDTTQETPTYSTYDDILDEGYSRRFYYQLALNYSRSFGDHNVSGLALFSRRQKHVFEDDSNDTFDYEYREENWVGRFTYNFKERYLVEFNGAYNGSENFAPGNRFGFFPSISLGYRLSEEPFIKNLAGDFLNNLKIRYSKGSSGKDGTSSSSDRFAYLQGYTTSGSVSFGSTSSTSYGPLYQEDGVANVNATWETSVKQNLGLEFKLFDKLTGSIDLFKEKRTGILMDVWSPLWYNIEDATGNVGETKNHGYELELGWGQNIGQNFRFNVKGSFAISENRVVKRGDGVYEEEYLKYAGKPIGYTQAYVVLGTYNSVDDIYNYTTPESASNQSTMVIGDYIYADYNADGVIDDLDKVAVDSYTKPLKNYTFSLAAQYKGWALNMSFYGVFDVYKKVGSMFNYANVNGSSGVYKNTTDIAEAWYSGTSASAMHSVYGSYSQNTSTYSYQDCSYLRLKNVELSYKFGKEITDLIKLGSLQLYTNGSNLYTWTKFNENIDPEQSGTSVYPMVKRINFGVRASF